MRGLSALLLVLIPFLACSAGAEEIKINIETRIQPAQTLGIILSRDGSEQVPVGAIERLADNLLIVSIPLPSNVARDALVTAMVMGADGQAAFGNTRPVTSPDPKTSFYGIPLCAPERVESAKIQNQASVLEQLLDVRAQRRGVLQEKVSKILLSTFLDNLKRLEVAFGLATDPELGPDLLPVELVDRLTRILAAIESHQGAAARSKTAKPSKGK